MRPLGTIECGDAERPRPFQRSITGRYMIVAQRRRLAQRRALSACDKTNTAIFTPTPMIADDHYHAAMSEASQMPNGH